MTNNPHLNLAFKESISTAHGNVKDRADFQHVALKASLEHLRHFVSLLFLFRSLNHLLLPPPPPFLSSCHRLLQVHDDDVAESAFLHQVPLLSLHYLAYWHSVMPPPHRSLPAPPPSPFPLVSSKHYSIQHVNRTAQHST